MTVQSDSYAFANSRAGQLERLHALESALDPGTIRHLTEIGVRPGWRCLEAGAGGGSIARWLAERVGPGGRVVAVDLDTSVLETTLKHVTATIHLHDVLAGDLPERGFHLIHARLLLGWLRDPQRALQTFVAALKPGGTVLVEEMEFTGVATTDRGPRGELFMRVFRAHLDVLAARLDPGYGARVAGDLRACGLVDLGDEARAAIWRGGSAGGEAVRLTLLQLRDAIVGTGQVSGDEVDATIALCGDPDFSWLSQVTVAAWGRLPADP